MKQPQLFSIIANAEIPSLRYRTDKPPTSGIMIKAVLWELWAYEGQPLTGPGIAARVSGDISTVLRALRAMERAGLITGHGIERRTFTLNGDVIDSYRTDVPLQRPRSGPTKEKRSEYGRMGGKASQRKIRERKQREREQQAAIHNGGVPEGLPADQKQSVPS
jgi:hypothetical protein